MQIREQVGLDFDDVLLVPSLSDIPSRNDVSLSTEVVRGVELTLPILSANMDTITEDWMAHAMDYLGGMGVLHRFAPWDVQTRWMKTLGEAGAQFGFSVGVNGDVGETLEHCVQAEELGATVVVVDVAHGHHTRVADLVDGLTLGQKLPVIAGNVATGEGAFILFSNGASAVKVGVGPGAVCTTRPRTGAGVPQLTAIAEAANVADGWQGKVIADGGIRNSGDIVKALAAGADCVMVGRLLAGTEECPGEVFVTGSGPQKQYRGMASKEAKEAAGMDTRNVEGAAQFVPARGLVSNIIYDLADGIRSGLSYVGARNIKELQARATFVRVTPNARNVGGR